MTEKQYDIRAAMADDADAVRRCAEQAYAMYVARIGKKPAPMIADFAGQIAKGLVHVVECAGDVAGFIVHFANDDHYFIENVALRPEHQGHGLGRRLLRFAEAEAQRQGFGRVELYTNAAMTENLEFYPRLGYVEFERRHEAGFSRVYFRKELAPIAPSH
ncbi:MAG: GNAT family N-acetyltransferase [Hyphomicrobiaceae bacterium]